MSLVLTCMISVFQSPVPAKTANPWCLTSAGDSYSIWRSFAVGNMQEVKKPSKLDTYGLEI